MARVLWFYGVADCPNSDQVCSLRGPGEQLIGQSHQQKHKETTRKTRTKKTTPQTLTYYFQIEILIFENNNAAQV